jgi:uncharacterized membrane protein
VLASISGSFIGVELLAYALFGWGFCAAVQRSRRAVFALLAAALFGFAVEYMFVTPSAQLPAWLQALLGSGGGGSGDSYAYGTFLIMIAGVPLWVPLGWASIIRAAMLTSERLGFTLLVAPLADGLLAASVDFALDPVAEALGYWKWHLTGGQAGLVTAFGIPLDNFLGWMMIVGGLSLTLRLGDRVVDRYGPKLWLELGCVALAIVVALVLSVGLQAVFNWMYARITPAGAFILVFGAAALLTVSRLPWLRRDTPVEPWPLALVGCFHVYLLAMFFSHRVYEAHPALLGFSPLLALASVLAFAWPSLSVLRRLLIARWLSPRVPEIGEARPL